MEAQKAQNSQRHPEKEKWSWRNEAPGLQTILQSKSHQKSMTLVSKKTYRSWIKTESPEMNPHIYVELIYDKVGKNIQWEKR